MTLFLIENKLKNHKKFIIFMSECIFAIILFCISIRHIFETTNLVVWDELGYWGSAAYLAGYDWSSVVTANAGYYSYGYSLILALILRLFAAGGHAYQIAILFNGLLCVCSYLLAIYVGCYFIGKEKKQYVVVFAFMVSMYGNNITQSCFAWSETVLIFLFWAIVSIFISIQHKYSFIKVLLLCITLVYMFLVHTRTIGIMIAGFLGIILVFIKNRRENSRKKIIQCVFVVCIFAILLLGGEFVKKIIKTEVWKVLPDAYLANTSSVLIGDTIRKFSINGIVEIIKTFLNRFFYWGSVSYFFIFVCIKEICVKIYNNIKKGEWNIVFFFLILAMLGNFGVLSLTLSFQGSYQALLYGRYADIMIGPFFLIGILLFMVNDKVKKRAVVLELFIYEVLQLILFYNANSIEITRDYFVANCNVDFYKYWIETDNGGYDYYRFMLIGILVYCCLLVIRYFINSKKMISAWMGITIILCVYCKSKYDVSEAVFYKTYTNYDGVVPVIDEIAEYCSDYDKIYFYRDDNWRCSPLEMWTQFRMYDKKIIDVKSLKELEDCMVLVPRELVQENTYLPSIEIEGEMILADKYIALYQLP